MACSGISSLGRRVTTTLVCISDSQEPLHPVLCPVQVSPTPAHRRLRRRPLCRTHGLLPGLPAAPPCTPARLAARSGAPAWLTSRSRTGSWTGGTRSLGCRAPVVFMSCFYVHLDDPRTRDPAQRAARLVKAMLPFRALTESYVSHRVPFQRP